MCLIDGSLQFAEEAKVPLVGRLRNSQLYAPMASEFLTAKILSPLGKAPLGTELVWQPPDDGWRCDFRVDPLGDLLIAEVKRPWVSRAIARLEREFFEDQARRDKPPNQGRMYTERQEAQFDRAEAKRFRPLFRKAAAQLQCSANIAAGKRWRRIPGILFVDTSPNWRVYNTIPWIRRWMDLRWARSVDLVVFLDYANRDGVWTVVAEPMWPPRTPRALSFLMLAHPFCSKGHIHVPQCPNGACDLPFGF